MGWLAVHPIRRVRLRTRLETVDSAVSCFPARCECQLRRLVVSASRRFTHGFQIDANYTWSHAIDTASDEIGYQQTDPSNQAIDKGNSDFDIRNNFVMDALWELPIFRGRHDFVGTMLGGWTITGILSKHSGFPFAALIGCCDTNTDRNGDGYLPDLPAAYNGGAINSPSKQQWINGIFPNPKASLISQLKGLDVAAGIFSRDPATLR